MFAGIAAHGMLPLDRALTAGVGLTLGAMCHVRWLADSPRRRAEDYQRAGSVTCNRLAAR